MIANITIIANEHNIGTIIGSCLSLNIKNMFTKISTITNPIITITPSINPKLYFSSLRRIEIFYRRVNRDKTYEIIQAAPNPNVHMITTNTSSSPPLHNYTIIFILFLVCVYKSVYSSLCVTTLTFCAVPCVSCFRIDRMLIFFCRTYRNTMRTCSSSFFLLS